MCDMDPFSKIRSHIANSLMTNTVAMYIASYLHRKASEITLCGFHLAMYHLSEGLSAVNIVVCTYMAREFYRCSVYLMTVIFA